MVDCDETCMVNLFNIVVGRCLKIELMWLIVMKLVW